MSGVENVTIGLPENLVRDIDRLNVDRREFVEDAVRNELTRRRRAELLKSLNNPYPDSVSLAEEGLAEWADRLPEEDTESLIDPNAGIPVRWVPGEGWVVRE